MYLILLYLLLKLWSTFHKSSLMSASLHSLIEQILNAKWTLYTDQSYHLQVHIYQETHRLKQLSYLCRYQSFETNCKYVLLWFCNQRKPPEMTSVFITYSIARSHQSYNLVRMKREHGFPIAINWTVAKPRYLEDTVDPEYQYGWDVVSPVFTLSPAI